jgi:hypothetical protein
MASTHDLRPTVDGNAWQNSAGRFQTKVFEIDFANDFTAGVAQNETVNLMTLPVCCTILSAKLYVETAQSTITDVDVGYSTDGSTNAALIDGATLATASVYDDGGTSLTAMVPLTAQNYLVFTNKDAQTITTAVIKIFVTLLDETI